MNCRNVQSVNDEEQKMKNTTIVSRLEYVWCCFWGVIFRKFLSIFHLLFSVSSSSSSPSLGLDFLSFFSIFMQCHAMVCHSYTIQSYSQSVSQVSSSTNTTTTPYTENLVTCNQIKLHMSLQSLLFREELFSFFVIFIEFEIITNDDGDQTEPNQTQPYHTILCHNTIPCFACLLATYIRSSSIHSLDVGSCFFSNLWK